MKDKIRLGNEEKVLHKGNEGQSPVRERGKVLHKGDEGQNPVWKPSKKSLIKIIKDSANFYGHLIGTTNGLIENKR